MDRLTGMRVFRRVVEKGGFSAAAEDLAMSVAAVSKHVARLEESLGARLLNRTTRRISVTEVGRVYHERVVRILDDIDETEAAVTDLHGAARGRLKINAPMSFGIAQMGGALAAFTEAEPEVDLDVTLNDRFVDLIDEGYDLAIRITTQLPDSALIARPVCPVRVIACASPGFVERHGAPRTVADLSRLPALSYSLRSPGAMHRFEGPDGVASLVERTVFRTNTAQLQREMLLAGIGYVVIPSFVVGPDIAEGRLVRLLPDHETDGHTLYCVYPHARHLAPKVRRFVDHMVAYFGPEPVWDRD